MTIKEALIYGEKQLAKLELPHLDAAVLLSFVLNKPKIFLYAHPEVSLTGKAIKKYKNLIARRAKREPVAYLTGVKEFYGREFVVNKNVLIPRPETELLIDEAKKISAEVIIDVGTGSGAIAVTLAKELKKTVLAIDISNKALAMAKRNAQYHHARIKLLHGNLLNALKHQNIKALKHENIKTKEAYEAYEALEASEAILIVANLPYLPTARKKLLPPEIKNYEPMLALLGGADGLNLYRRLISQIKKMNWKNWTLLAEIDSNQENAFKKIAAGMLVSFKQDLSGTIRAVIVKNK